MRLARLLLLIPLALAACDTGGGALPFDPDAPYVPSGPPTLELGFYYGGFDDYTVLEEDGACDIVWAPQGGTWSMPTLRTRGMAQTAHLVCELVTAAGESVGRTETEKKFKKIPKGGVELRELPIRIRHAAPNKTAPIDDLYGQDATLDCEVDDDEGREAELEVPVVLTEGTWG
jgi:hypothetical protein